MADCSNSEKDCQQRTGIIYKITNLSDGKVYVGQTVQKLRERLNQHKGSNTKKGIDGAIKKYGWEKFKVEVIEEVPEEMLDEREIFWIKELDCRSPKGYNLTAGGEGSYIRTEETRAKNSAANKGRPAHNKGKPMSEEQKAKLSEARKNPSPETRAKLSAAHKGRVPWNKGKKLPPLSEEHKAKISASNQNPPPEIRAKMSEANRGENNPFYGHKHTEESKAKMSASKVGTQCGENNPFYGHEHTPETRAKLSAVHKGKTISPETRVKMSEAHKNPSPETRAKLSEANKGEKNPCYGKHHTPETKAKIAETKRNKKLAEEKKSDISISLFENDNN